MAEYRPPSVYTTFLNPSMDTQVDAVFCLLSEEYIFLFKMRTSFPLYMRPPVRQLDYTATPLGWEVFIGVCF